MVEAVIFWSPRAASFFIAADGDACSISPSQRTFAFFLRAKKPQDRSLGTSEG